jgi:hypothetical protein
VWNVPPLTRGMVMEDDRSLGEQLQKGLS